MTALSALVTGGTGFLGGQLARRLHQLGWNVAVIGRNEQAGYALQAAGIRFIQGDLRDQAAVEAACSGIDTVFHCAALSSPWGSYQSFYSCNVEATAHVIAGCQKKGAARLVNVSTPSIYFNGRDQLNIREDYPLPARPVNAYAATKRLAEEAVAAAHRPSAGLVTITLRPRAIFGPGDSAILPRLIRANNSSGVPLFRNGNAMLDLTYIDNAVDALIAAAAAPVEAAGQAYNITNGEPVQLKEALNQLFKLLREPMRSRRIPFPLAKSMAALLEAAAWLRPGRPEPVMTRYTVSLLSISQTFDIAAAQKKLGYAPRISIQEGLEHFAEWWRNN
ncbi:NAD-dependent epimerase/dehydratase family protein [Paenibacillus sp. GCM10027626]|uniref:NAD-dependent epimerase/dehydratase family protein n=1 Tax=Paenibacillus sp. GCM10027626 TaxID=3273411 RepID=UPI0036444609